MPVVTIESWPLDEEKKPEIIKNITKVFTDIGIPSQAVTIILHETKISANPLFVYLSFELLQFIF